MAPKGHACQPSTDGVTAKRVLSALTPQKLPPHCRDMTGGSAAGSRPPQFWLPLGVWCAMTLGGVARCIQETAH